MQSSKAVIGSMAREPASSRGFTCLRNIIIDFTLVSHGILHTVAVLMTAFQMSSLFRRQVAEVIQVYE